MREVEIPGGKAYFREMGVDPIPGNSRKLLKAAGNACYSQLGEDFPELFADIPGETDEQREARLEAVRMRLSVRQATVLEEVKEATAVAMLDHWTLDLALPTMETLGEARYAELYEDLLAAVASMPSPAVGVDFSPGPIEDKGSPTTGSGDSAGPSEDSRPNLSTTTPESGGSPSSGEASSLEQ